jgi:DNA mismatch repair protein MutL
MSRIHVLPLNLRNKIAAGEVIERPASVVKELIENSIDAGASRIEIDILRAGKRLIKVSDNGIGMDRKDALLAFERYATSKIKDEDDLFNIRTMGFRGEALSSVASVSKIRLITAARNMEIVAKRGEGGFFNRLGTCIEIIGGEIKDVKDCASLGTNIEVKDLFFNTPARRKFLKSDSTENYHTIDVVTREALSHYHIGFVLRIDGDDVLNLPAASSLRERLVQVFGADFIDRTLEIETQTSDIGIRAFLGKATNVRNNKNNQFLFINNRPVKDQSVTYAVYKAYEGMIPKDKHPVFFLFININPKMVDFNVHPTKKEVRFADKSTIFNAVYRAASEALKTCVSENWTIGETAQDTTQHSAVPSFYSSTPPSLHYSSMVSESSSFYNIISHMESIPFIYLGDTFIAIPEKNGITIIDYHAAYERINYERLLEGSRIKGQGSSYKLLFPQHVKLQGSECRVILENNDVLNELGLEVEDFGHGTIIIRSLPEFLKDADAHSLMSDIAASLINLSKLDPERLEPFDSVKKRVAAKMACHLSLRRKEVTDCMKIAQLLKDLDNMENPSACPHGRPTKIFISTDELRKMFKK